MQELLLEPISAFVCDNPFSGHEARRQRSGYINAYRQQQRLPGDRQFANAQQKAAQRSVEQKHYQRIYGDHHQCMAVISLCQIAPNQHHRSAGGDAQQYAAGQIASPQRYFEHLYSVGQYHSACSIAVADIGACS